MNTKIWAQVHLQYLQLVSKKNPHVAFASLVGPAQELLEPSPATRLLPALLHPVPPKFSLVLSPAIILYYQCNIIMYSSTHIQYNT